MKFIDCARFMATSLSNLADNLTEGIHKIKCKDCDCFLEYESVKDNSIQFKCLCCDKICSNKIDEELKKKFKNTFKFPDNDINNFVLLFRKGVYPMNIQMNGKNLMNHHCLKKNYFIAI